MGTEIRNSDIQKRMMEELGLQSSMDKIPSQLAEKIVPVFVSNPKGKKKILYFNDNNTRNFLTNGLYVPVGKKWKLLSICLSLDNDATVINRVVEFGIFGRDPLMLDNFWLKSSVVQTASQGIYWYNFCTNFSDETIITSGTNKYIQLPLMDVPMTEGFSIWPVINGVQAGDDVLITCIIEETDLILDEYEEKNVP